LALRLCIPLSTDDTHYAYIASQYAERVDSQSIR
jgi:hypothetical protein